MTKRFQRYALEVKQLQKKKKEKRKKKKENSIQKKKKSDKGNFDIKSLKRSKKKSI